MLAKDTWSAVLGELQILVNRPTYETWLRRTEGLTISDGALTVGVPNSFAIEWLERRMYQLIRKTVQRVAEQPLDVHFQVNPRGAAEPPSGRRGSGPTPWGAATQVRAIGAPLNPKYTFDSFVVGPNNRLAYSAACAVAEAPGKVYHPLFIYSGVGLGKTHLLHAIGHSCVSRGLRALYVTCEQFTNDFVAAIRNRTTEEFRGRYRSVEVLLMDDVQFIIGKEQTQEVLFHTFNDLYNSDKQIVLTSDRPPKALSLLEDRLLSRFGWGLIADIQPPDLETRMAILSAKADQMGITQLEGSVIEYVAKKVHTNVRDLEGSLNRLLALGRTARSTITLETAATAIGDYMHERGHGTADPGTVLERVAGRFRVPLTDLSGPSRKKGAVRARHVAMYLLHEELGMRDTDIGRLLGNRDHSTVIHAVAKVEYQINVDADLRRVVLDLREAIAA